MGVAAGGLAAASWADWRAAAAAALERAPDRIDVRTLSGGTTPISSKELKDLAAALGGAPILPGDPTYEATRRTWNGAFDLHPALIIACTGVSDVTAAVQFAAAHSLLTAVRGGGHSITGKSSVEGGLMIDLAPMRGVRVDPAARTARAEGGSLLGDLDRESRRFQLATPAGIVSHTGAAGLTLGGGFGRLSRRFGLTCDNLVGADLVTADGRFVSASERENPDLLWGLRGGGGNFGVVTSLEYALHPMEPTILTGQLVWPLAQAREVLRGWRDFCAGNPEAMHTTVVLTRVPDAGAVLVIEPFWSLDHADGERLFAPLRALGKPVVDKVGPLDYATLQSAGDALSPHGIRHYGKSGFMQSVSDEAIDTLVATFEAGATRPETWILQQTGGAINRVAPDATAFPERSSRFWLVFNTDWHDPAQDDANIAGAREAWKQVEHYTSGFYVNTMSPDQDSRVNRNYGGNYARLVQLKDRYDPKNLFRLNANVQPSKATQS